MKQLIGLSVITAFILCFSSFSHSTSSGEKDEISNADVWKHMSENVFNKLNKLVDYDEESIFSRCPSGFGQYKDDNISNNKIVFGTITFAEGCAREEFCLYKLNWETKKTYLKKTAPDNYLSVNEFIKEQKPKTAKI